MKKYIYSVRIEDTNKTIARETVSARSDGECSPFDRAFATLSRMAERSKLGLSDPEEVDRSEDIHVYAVDKYDVDGNLVKEYAGVIELEQIIEW